MRSLQKQASVFLVLFLTFFVGSSLHSLAFARTYGQDSYGTGLYGTSRDTTTSNAAPLQGSTTETPVCDAQKPGGSAPWLYGAIPQSANSITLYFTENSDPVDSYAVEYGTQAGSYHYSALNVGGKGTRTYLVESLSPNTTYYFRVRAGNGCATGEWSNEISAKTKGWVSTQSLEIQSSELVPEELPATPLSPESPVVHTDGYEVRVQVVNPDKKPLEGVTVTMHSTPRSGQTDKDGRVTFDNVEAGEHQVLIAFNDYEGQQTLNLSGDTKTVNLVIVVEQKNVLFSKEALIIIGVLGIVIVSLLVYLLRKRTR